MTYDPNAARHILALTIGDGDLDSLLTALDEIPCRIGSAAGAFDLLAEGFRSGFFDGQDGRVASLCELLGRGMHFLAEEEGELVNLHADALRRAKEKAPIEFAKPKREGWKL